MQREWPRTPCELQPRFFRSAVALAIVALIAAGNEIFPGRMSAARTRHYVIKRQLRRRKRTRAELARIPVTQQNVLARKSAALLRNVPVSQQTNYRRHRNGSRTGMYYRSVAFFRLRHALEHQDQRATHCRHVDRLEGGI